MGNKHSREALPNLWSFSMFGSLHFLFHVKFAKMTLEISTFGPGNVLAESVSTEAQIVF